MAYTKRPDQRKMDEIRPMSAKVGVIPNADGSAIWEQGDTIAIASVFGPKILNPKHQQDPTKGLLRVRYSMLPFSVTERIRPGISRRSQEINQVTEWALSSVVLLEELPGTVVEVHIIIPQANAGTRCAGINAAALALAHAGVPMKELVSAISVGKIDDKIVTDIIKEEEDHEEGEGATDIPLAFLSVSEKISLLQLDGRIPADRLLEAVEAGRVAAKKVYEVQKKALKDIKVLEEKSNE